MKKIKYLLLGFLFCMFLIQSFGQQDQRIHVAYVLAFGRDASGKELNYWLGRGDFSIDQLIEFHRQGFVEYPNLHSETINLAYMDALGRTPSENEMKYWVNGVDIYIQLINNHLKYLKSNLSEYKRVIRASYISVFNREPDIAVINFWEKQTVMPFYMLVSCHKNSLRKKNNEFLNYGSIDIKNLPAVSSIFLSTTTANEAYKYINSNARELLTHAGKHPEKNDNFIKKSNIQTSKIVNIE